MKHISVSCIEHDRLQFFSDEAKAHEYARHLVDLYGSGSPDMIEFPTEDAMWEFWNYYIEGEQI